MLAGTRVSSAGVKSAGEAVSSRHSPLLASDDSHHQHQGGDSHQHPDHCWPFVRLGNYWQVSARIVVSAINA